MLGVMGGHASILSHPDAPVDPHMLCMRMLSLPPATSTLLTVSLPFMKALSFLRVGTSVSRLPR